MRVFGPILGNELRRLARRKRTFILRGVYLLILFVIVSLVPYLWLKQTHLHSQISDLGVAIFMTFTLVQYAAVLLLAPPLTAGTIADEKDLGTLGLLFATGLSYGEIIRGKLTSRLALLAMLLLAGIPVMSLSLVFGGVSIWQILVVFLLTAVTAVFAGSISTFFSTIFQKAYSASIGSYLIIFGYLVGIPLVVISIWGFTHFRFVPDFLFYMNPLMCLGGCLANDYGGANPIAANISSISLSLFFSWLALTLSVRLLPTATFWQPGKMMKRFFQDIDSFYERINIKRIRFTFWGENTLDKSPILWQEVHARTLGQGEHMFRVAFLLVILSQFFIVFLCVAISLERIWLWPIYCQAALVFLATIFLSSASFTAEKERHSWDVLLATPLSGEIIAWGKAFGVWRNMLFILLLPAFQMALFGSGQFISWARALEIILTVGIFSFFLSVLGLFFSLIARRTSQALIITLSIFLGVAVVLPVVAYVFSMYSPQGMTGARAVFVYASPFAHISGWSRWGLSRPYYRLMTLNTSYLVERILIMFFYFSVSLVLLFIMIRWFDFLAKRCRQRLALTYRSTLRRNLEGPVKQNL